MKQSIPFRGPKNASAYWQTFSIGPLHTLKKICLHLICILCALPLLLSTGARAQVKVPISIPDGDLAGSSMNGVDQFLGIPYAAAPLRQLRWSAPQAVTPWSGVRDASQFQSPCAQAVSYPGPDDRSVSEDCLFLNVYRPAEDQVHHPLPVMVWIHGGSNIDGSGKDYDPTAMVKQNSIIVVTINYRLGVFGFLPVPFKKESNGSESGNFALMDQQAALRWVQKNIAAFGGDPEKVTVAGESAGAFDICSQLASPQAAGLFQQVVLESYDCTQATRATAYSNLQKIASNLRCEQTDPSRLGTCLMSQTTRALLDASEDISSFGAYVDRDILPVQPEIAIATGNWNRVPVLLGSNQDESALVTFGVLERQKKWPLDQPSYVNILKGAFPTSATEVETEYDSSEYPTPFSALSGIYTDTNDQVGCDESRQADILAKATSVYRYEFADPNTPVQLPLIKRYGHLSLGAYHSGELQYLFKVDSFSGPLTSQQHALATRMDSYWAAFIKSGKPIVNGDGWPTYSSEDKTFLVLSPAGDSIAQDFDREHHCLFWATHPKPVPLSSAKDNAE